MAEKKHQGRSDHQSHHLALPEEDTQEWSTIYKLSTSMKRRLSPQSPETPSPEGAHELQILLRRLVEIDVESRKILRRVFSLVEKDEKLEDYIQKRIEDPKVSKMWELIELLLAQQEEVNINSNNHELIVNDDDNSNYSCFDKGIKTNETDEEKNNKLERFKIKTLQTSGEVKDMETKSTASGKYREYH